MTALEVLNRVDARLHNVFTWEEKLHWLNGLEQLVYACLLYTSPSPRDRG